MSSASLKTTYAWRAACASGTGHSVWWVWFAAGVHVRRVSAQQPMRLRTQVHVKPPAAACSEPQPACWGSWVAGLWGMASGATPHTRHAAQPSHKELERA